MNHLPQKRIGVAVIWNDASQILIDRRKAGGAMGGLWEFPGGKIEAGETEIDCIRREIKEELDIEITVGDLLIEITHDYPTFQVTLIVHHCHYRSGTPQPIECDEIRWVEPQELWQYEFPGANVRIIEAILNNYG
jgi:mutator protein MutT